MHIQHGCEVTTVPVFTKSDEVLSLYPDSIFLSNGPRDPAGVSHAINNVKQLIDKKLIFGICLWRQILCLALGAKSFKLRFGYRGGNRPVIDLKSKKVEIASKNHGFAIVNESLSEDLEQTHINLNDKTFEGDAIKQLPYFPCNIILNPHRVRMTPVIFLKNFIKMMNGAS